MARPYEDSWEEIKVRVQKAYSNPNVGTVTQLELKPGPQSWRLATLTEIVDPKTKEFHHYSLKIDQINRTKRRGWFADSERSVRLDGDSPDEIRRLYDFLHALYEGKLSSETGDLHLIRAADFAKLEKVLEAIPNLASGDKLQLVQTILSQFDDSPSHLEEFAAAFRGSHPETLKHIAVASRMVEYKAAYDALLEMVRNEERSETKLQNHLKDNPWMFGSEYSELLPRRKWTRDKTLDFMHRRTVDGYLEIVEIKTPFSDPLFVYDKNHETYYPSAMLSPPLAQVIGYIEDIERNRESIVSMDNEDPLKIRAKIILGRDGPEEHRLALRNLNGHLHRIEVVTFDQLLKIADRVLSVFVEKSNEDGDEQTPPI